jgi:hypothetical protein
MKGADAHCRTHLFVLLLALTYFRTTLAYPMTAGTSSTHRTTALHAWSLPIDTSSFTFRTTWYDEYNPTARVTVYNEYVSSHCCLSF